MNLETGLQCRIVRGADEVGGSCVELEADGRRLLVDLGSPLIDDGSSLPDVQGLREPAADLLGVVISHSHPDHWGRLCEAGQHLRVFASEATAALWDVAETFAARPKPPQSDIRTFRPGEELSIGPFRLLPIAVDHSAADGHALRIEAGGRSLLYTGDFRDHGRRPQRTAGLFAAAAEVDVVLCEGTVVGRTRNSQSARSEVDVGRRLWAIFRETEGLVMLWASGQNIDRLATAADMAVATDRRLLIDAYTAEAARAVGCRELKPDGDRVALFVPLHQRRRLARLGDRARPTLDRLRANWRFRVWSEDLASVADESVLLTRPSMLDELVKLGCLNNAAWVTSLWSGYIAREPQLSPRLADLGVATYTAHCSGHADVATLRRLIEESGSAMVIPMHTARPDMVAALSERVIVKPNGECWEV